MELEDCFYFLSCPFEESISLLRLSAWWCVSVVGGVMRRRDLIYVQAGRPAHVKLLPRRRPSQIKHHSRYCAVLEGFHKFSYSPKVRFFTTQNFHQCENVSILLQCYYLPTVSQREILSVLKFIFM